MNLTDVVIVLTALFFAWFCWREGVLRALWGAVGLIVGALLGIAVAPLLLNRLPLSLWLSAATIAVVAFCTVAGRFALVRAGQRLRPDDWRPPRFDRTAGAAFGVIATLSVSWILGVTLAGSRLPELGGGARQSMIVSTLDSLPLPFSHWLKSRFEHLRRDTHFNDLVSILDAEHIAPVAPPNGAVVDRRAVQQSANSVWRVLAGQQGSMSGSQGTGFLIAEERVMTAAHVIDGDDTIHLEVDGEALPAEVVVCDPVHDIAVLDVPGLTGDPLPFAVTERGAMAAVVGFPDNGDLTIGAARIRERLRWFTTDIRGQGWHPNDAYSVRGTVRGGNSGGPLVSHRGAVVGLVVASSAEDDETGYALSLAQISTALSQGLQGEVGSADACR